MLSVNSSSMNRKTKHHGLRRSPTTFGQTNLVGSNLFPLAGAGLWKARREKRAQVDYADGVSVNQGQRARPAQRRGHQVIKPKKEEDLNRKGHTAAAALHGSKGCIRSCTWGVRGDMRGRAAKPATFGAKLDHLAKFAAA